LFSLCDNPSQQRLIDTPTAESVLGIFSSMSLSDYEAFTEAFADFTIFRTFSPSV